MVARWRGPPVHGVHRSTGDGSNDGHDNWAFPQAAAYPEGSPLESNRRAAHYLSTPATTAKVSSAMIAWPNRSQANPSAHSRIAALSKFPASARPTASANA